MAMTAESLRGPLRFTIDLKSGLIQQPIRPQLMKGDKRANTIVVALTEDKKPVDLSGVTVTGSFISPMDDAEIPLTGSVNGNEASVTLVDECYAEEGHFEANIKLTAGETSRTILSITGHVLSKGSGAVIDVGDVIPSIDDIIAQYATMKQVTKDAQDAADAANAAAEHAPYINEETNHWMTWDASESTYADTGVAATGPQGEPGTDGDDGDTPYIGENGNWWIGGVDTGTKAQGPAGANGTGSGTVTGIQIGSETYEPNDAGVVALPETGGGVPDGGTTGQMLFKISNDDGATEWQTPTHDKVGALGSDPQEGGEEAPEMQAVPNADQMEAIKKKYPIRDANNQPCTFPTFGSQVFGEDEDKRALWQADKGFYADDSAKLNGKPAESYMPYTNLADNSDFTHWVAQAGIGGMHGTQAYGGDRWILTDGTITGTDNTDGDGYSAVTLNGTLVQVVPYPPAVATAFVEMVSGTATISYDASKGEIILSSTGGVIKNVLLLEGEWAKKPTYVSKGYDAELMVCGKYMQEHYAVNAYFSQGSSYIIEVPFQVHMRAISRIEGTSGSVLIPGLTADGTVDLTNIYVFENGHGSADVSSISHPGKDFQTKFNMRFFADLTRR